VTVHRDERSKQGRMPALREWRGTRAIVRVQCESKMFERANPLQDCIRAREG